MTRKPQVGDEVRRKDQHQLGRVVRLDKDGEHADVDWPHLKPTGENPRRERLADLVVVTRA